MGKDLRLMRCIVTSWQVVALQMQFIFPEKHSAANKLLYLATVDLEKTFNCVPMDFIW